MRSRPWWAISSRIPNHIERHSGALLREPGTHTPRPVVMVSGLATKRWRPGMTEPPVYRRRCANDRFHRIGLLRSNSLQVLDQVVLLRAAEVELEMVVVVIDHIT
jgi:hypothetical protein